jgi:6-phospho-beta-glucosidase
VPPERIELEHVGLNHLTWERAIRVDGVDRLPELLADSGAMLAAEVGLPLELLEALGALPSYYLHYYYATREVVEEQRTAPIRAEEVMEIERSLLALYRDPTLDVKPALLEQRGGAFYSEAAAQLIASLHAGTGDVQVVNVRNAGALPNLPDGAVVEVPARIDREGAHPLALAPLAPELRGLAAHALAYEELAIAAAITGDRRAALRALLANPLVPGFATARDLLAALLEANRGHLPRFFPA